MYCLCTAQLARVSLPQDHVSPRNYYRLWCYLHNQLPQCHSSSGVTGMNRRVWLLLWGIMNKSTPPNTAQFLSVPRVPTVVRAGGTALFSFATAGMAMPLGYGIRAIILVLGVGGALLLTFSHPYRTQVRAAVESRGVAYKTQVAQLLPLFPLWLLLMVLPIFPASWLLAAGVAVVAGAYIWVVYPQIDGTKFIA